MCQEPIESRRFRYFTECERTVADDTCIRIDHSSYAARPALIGSRVLVRLYEHQIEIRDRRTHALLRTQPPLVIELPPMSDKTVFEMHRCLGTLLAALESSYELQLRRYYDQHPQHERPARFEGEPF